MRIEMLQRVVAPAPGGAVWIAAARPPATRRGVRSPRLTRPAAVAAYRAAIAARARDRSAGHPRAGVRASAAHAESRRAPRPIASRSTGGAGSKSNDLAGAPTALERSIALEPNGPGRAVPARARAPGAEGGRGRAGAIRADDPRGRARAPRRSSATLTSKRRASTNGSGRPTMRSTTTARPLRSSAPATDTRVARDARAHASPRAVASIARAAPDPSERSRFRDLIALRRSIAREQFDRDRVATRASIGRAHCAPTKLLCAFLTRRQQFVLDT